MRPAGAGSTWRSFLSEILTVSAGKALGGVAAIATTVFLSRWLGPAEFGLFATFLSLQLLLAGLAGDAIDTGTVRFVSLYRRSEPGKAVMTLSLGFMLKVTIGIVSILAGAVAAPTVAALLFHDPDAVGLVLAVAAGALGLQVFRSALAYLQAHESFGRYVVLEGAHSLGRLAAVLSLAAAGVLTAATGAMAVSLLPLALAVAAVVLVPGAYPRARRLDRAILRPLATYSGWAMASAVAVSIHSRLDVLMLGWMRGPEAAGIYAAAAGLALSLELFAGALLTVFLPKIASATGPEFALLCRRYRLVVIPLLLAASAVALLVGPSVLVLASGSSYGGSVSVFQVLVVGLTLSHVVIPQVLRIWVTRPGLGALVDLAALPAVYVGNLLWIPAHGALGAASNALMVRAAMVLAIVVLARRLSHGSPAGVRSTRPADSDERRAADGDIGIAPAVPPVAIARAGAERGRPGARSW